MAKKHNTDLACKAIGKRTIYLISFRKPYRKHNKNDLPNQRNENPRLVFLLTATFLDFSGVRPKNLIIINYNFSGTFFRKRCRRATSIFIFFYFLQIKTIFGGCSMKSFDL